MLKASYQTLKGNGTEDMAFWTVEDEGTVLWNEWPDIDSIIEEATELLSRAGIDAGDVQSTAPIDDGVTEVRFEGAAVRFFWAA